MTTMKTTKLLSVHSAEPDALFAVLDETHPGLTARVTPEDIRAIHLAGVAIAVEALLAEFASAHLHQLERGWTQQTKLDGGEE